MASAGRMSQHQRIAWLGAASAMPPGGQSLAVPAIIGAAWLILLVAQVADSSGAFHHHALLEAGSPLQIAVPTFLVAWLVMVTAMMLPASLPTIRAVEAAARSQNRARRDCGAFLAVFALVWTAFGLVVFTGDVALHRLVDTTPWLAARPWLIEAAVLAVAGGYQLAAYKRQSLAACRPEGGPARSASLIVQDAGRLGLRHGRACLGSSWALMVLMFAEGFANLWWMVALTAVMAYETTGRHGHRAAPMVGLVLLLAAMTILVSALPGAA